MKKFIMFVVIVLYLIKVFFKIKNVNLEGLYIVNI